MMPKLVRVSMIINKTDNISKHSKPIATGFQNNSPHTAQTKHNITYFTKNLKHMTACHCALTIFHDFV